MNEQWNPLASNINWKDERVKALCEWLLKASPSEITGLSPMGGDASFRRYFRLTTQDGSYVVMDAPPGKEDAQRFMVVAKALITMGLQAPTVYAHNIQEGFLILSDFGDLTYLQALKTHPPGPLYQNALKALSILQQPKTSQGFTLPHFTNDFMQTEWAWHKEWFLSKLLELNNVDLNPSLNISYEALVESALLQPQVFMYRDFHAGNLMLLANGTIGLLDFQDAFIGPITYDPASLLRDCYIDWPENWVTEWALFYYHLLWNQGTFQNVSESQFLQWFDWMGVQRHLKALMTFARKALRDNNPDYLVFIPRTLNYIVSVSNRYDALSPLASFYEETVLPRFHSLKLI